MLQQNQLMKNRKETFISASNLDTFYKNGRRSRLCGSVKSMDNRLTFETVALGRREVLLVLDVNISFSR
jgi:hypothetical protein